MNDLENLFAILATNPRLGSAAICEKYGISPRAVSLAFGPFIWRVRFDGNRFIEDANGEMAGVLPIIDGGYFTDLVAFTTDKIATHDGRAFCLGDLSLPNFADAPLRVFRHPLQWLQNNCDGIVILKPEIAWRELDHVALLGAEDEVHRLSLMRLMAPPKSRVKILIPKTKAAA